eukprot:1110223-Pyramimonas_sp.AAC.1
MVILSHKPCGYPLDSFVETYEASLALLSTTAVAVVRFDIPQRYPPSYMLPSGTDTAFVFNEAAQASSSSNGSQSVCRDKHRHFTQDELRAALVLQPGRYKLDESEYGDYASGTGTVSQYKGQT